MRYLLLGLLFGITLVALPCQAQKPVRVEVKKTGDQWQLFRNGAPYYVKGAGGHVHLDLLVDAGGNSIRTWSVADAQEILDECQSKGLTVMMGLWVGHERHGFDYDNPKAIAAQLERFREAVTRLKDHPALLVWAVGNEVNLQYTNHKVWYAVNDIAKMIKAIDPNHPTTTVTAGLAQQEVNLIKERCPDLDFLSVNTYGDLVNVKDNIRKFGWNGPYMITEWGPNGHWEVSKSEWGTPYEQNSAEKAESYRERYKKYIAGDKTLCMGSYVFLWGQKQETTASWYGLFSAKGESTPAVDELYLAWSGEYPENRSPQLEWVTVDGKKGADNIYLDAEELYTAEVVVTDPDNDKLKIKWQIIPESTDIKSGGDAEQAPVSIPGLIKSSKGNQLIFRAPKAEGAYRVFVWISDGNNHIAYANIPFYTVPRPADAPQPQGVRFKKVTMESFNSN